MMGTINSASVTMEGTHARIVLKEGDLLHEAGLRIVHCASQFETDQAIVSKGSLLAKWMNYCESKGIDFNAQIDRFCQDNRQAAVKDDTLKPYRTLKFPTGTLCPVEGEEDVFCLAAFCEPYNNKHVENLTFAQYLGYWEGIWENLSHLPIRRDMVSVALAGGHCVMVGSNYFTTAQKIAMVVHTFCKQMLKMSFCKQLNIVVFGPDVEEIDFEAWEKHLLPFLTEMSHLPFYWAPGEKPINIPKPSTNTEGSSNGEAFDSFSEDFLEMVSNLESVEGSPVEQYVGTGTRTERFCVHANVIELRSILDSIAGNEELRNYFGRKRGNTYDKWSMLQLWGFIQDETPHLGLLNRKNTMSICMGCPEATDEMPLPERWRSFAPKFESLFKYVGQQLSQLKAKKPTIYEQLKSI